MDDIEREIDSVESARALLSERAPRYLSQLQDWREQTADFFARSPTGLIDRAVGVISICIARIYLRHGSGARPHLYFHDEQHPFDLLARLARLQSRSPDPLTVEEYIILALFAAGHDLVQAFSGQTDDGIGNNEKASADELARIIRIVGMDRVLERAKCDLLTPMVHATTFHSRPFCFDGWEYCGGVLAPLLLARLQDERIQSDGRSISGYQARLILMASDIDTGNVADPFVDFIDRAVRLCRERLAVGAALELDMGSANDVYTFLTNDQEYYFFCLQCFNEQTTRQCFQADKIANGHRLQALTVAMRERFADQIGNPAREPDVRQLFSDYIDLAARVS